MKITISLMEVNYITAYVNEREGGLLKESQSLGLQSYSSSCFLKKTKYVNGVG